MPADDPARIDDASIRCAYQSATEREILRGRKMTRQRRRRFQVGHQNRGRVPIWGVNDAHPFEMRQVRSRGRSGKVRHPRQGLGQMAHTDSFSVGVVDSNRRRYTGEVGSRGREPPTHRRHRRKGCGLEFVDEVGQLGIHHPTKPIAIATRIGEMKATVTQEHRPPTFRRGPATPEGLAKELKNLRAEEVRTHQHCRIHSERPEGQSNLVRDEHKSPRGVVNGRPVARIVQRR